MKKVLIIKGFIAALIIAVLGQLTSCQNEDGFTQESTEKVNLIDYDVTKAGLCGIAFNQFADNYPNGIIISCEIIPVPIIGCYNDWSFKGQ